MASAAPRISPRLIRAIQSHDDGTASIADVYRSIARMAERIGVPRPSYEQVRVHVHAARRWRRSHPPATEVAVDVAFRVKPVTAVLDHLAGTD